MKANFKKLSVEASFDVFVEVDVTKELGNYIHSHTIDIGLDDTARAIYHSEGEIDIPNEHAPLICSLINSNDCMLLAFVKKAIIKTLTNNEHNQ